METTILSKSLTPVETPQGFAYLQWVALPTTLDAASRKAWLHRCVSQMWLPRTPLHWPPGHQALNAPDAQHWVSWSYWHQPNTLPEYALVAYAPFAIGVDVCHSQALPMDAWHSVLSLYAGAMHPHQPPALQWARLEAIEKCLRTGLREWSPDVAAERLHCQSIPVKVPHPHAHAALAYYMLASDLNLQ